MKQIVRQKRQQRYQRFQENEILRHSRPHPPAAVIESSLPISGHQTVTCQNEQIPRPAQPQPRGEAKPEVSAVDAAKILKAFEDGAKESHPSVIRSSNNKQNKPKPRESAPHRNCERGVPGRARHQHAIFSRTESTQKRSLVDFANRRWWD
jgi:hypothetical protein